MKWIRYSLICGLVNLMMWCAPCLGQNGRLEFTQIADSIYLYTTWSDPGNGSLFPSNGLYMVTREGIAILDTPWDTTQFQPFLDSLAARHTVAPKFCISTHWHDDRTAGVAYFEAQGIETWCLDKTREACIREKNKVPAHTFEDHKTFQLGGYVLEAAFHGAGHAPDNIIVYIPHAKILYGGCLIKSKESKGLGFTGDAVLSEWPATMRKLLATYPEATMVIPGHQAYGDLSLVHWTLKLLRKAGYKG